MSLVEHDNGVRNDANDNGGNAVENVGGEPNYSTETITAKFREVDSRAYSEGHSNQARDPKNESRAHDGIRHSTARFAYGLRSLSQESPIDGSEASVKQIAKDGNQRHQHQHHCHHGQAGHYMVGDAASQADLGYLALGGNGLNGFRHDPSQTVRA